MEEEEVGMRRLLPAIFQLEIAVLMWNCERIQLRFANIHFITFEDVLKLAICKSNSLKRVTAHKQVVLADIKFVTSKF